MAWTSHPPSQDVPRCFGMCTILDNQTNQTCLMGHRDWHRRWVWEDILPVGTNRILVGLRPSHSIPDPACKLLSESTSLDVAQIPWSYPRWTPSVDWTLYSTERPQHITRFLQVYWCTRVNTSMVKPSHLNLAKLYLSHQWLEEAGIRIIPDSYKVRKLYKSIAASPGSQMAPKWAIIIA